MKKDKLILAALWLAVLIGITVMKTEAVWDVATPAGSEAKSLGDDRIREFKTDVQTALRNAGTFPGTDTSDPKFIPALSTGPTSTRPTGSSVSTGSWRVNTDSHTIERYDGASWISQDVVGSSNVEPSDLSTNTYGRGLASDSSGVRIQIDTNTFTLNSSTLSLNLSGTAFPKFRVEVSSNSGNVTGDGTLYAVPITSVIFDTSMGVSTGSIPVYTIPTSGYYRLTGSVTLGDIDQSGSGGNVNIYLLTSRGKYDILASSQNSAGLAETFYPMQYTWSGTHTIRLYAGDTVTFYTQVLGGTKNTDLRGFNGQGIRSTYLEGNLIP